MNKILSFLLLGGLLMACAPKMEPLQYGEDACAYCKMTIVDSRYGAEIVSQKGKVYKYDAVECMVNHSHEASDFGESDVHSRYAVDFDQPGQLLPAESLHYLYCLEMPSPMGMYLSAYSSLENLELTMASKGGKHLDWQHMQTYVLSNELPE